MPTIDLLAEHPLSAELVSLIDAAPLPGLAGLPQCAQTRQAIRDLVADGPMAGTLAEAALWLLAGELERSHSVSQAVDTAEGSFWHGIMHRREGDFGNAKYWFRRVGSGHPVHRALAEQIRVSGDLLGEQGLPTGALSDPQSLPEALVDLSQSAASGKPQWTSDLERIGWWEWQLLFAHCTR